ncbi:MAG: hypothetical protein HPM95_14810 [Alphaproteobacteria bacterium]|nr:hypothetical protein [Alphaproteobacteria bacterium]
MIVAGTRGGIVSGCCSSPQARFAMLALSLVYVTFGASPLVAGLFFGIKAGVFRYRAAGAGAVVGAGDDFRRRACHCRRLLLRAVPFDLPFLW